MHHEEDHKPTLLELVQLRAEFSLIHIPNTLGHDHLAEHCLLCLIDNAEQEFAIRILKATEHERT